MTLKEFERWQSIRQGGRTSFIWMQGVLGYGVVMAVVMAIVLTLFNMIGGGGFDPHFLVRQLVIDLIFFPLVGYGWGAWVWSRTEKRYQQEKAKLAPSGMQS